MMRFILFVSGKAKGDLPMKIGLIADIHGDLAGFNAALSICEREQVDLMLCAGDIVERGSDADEIVRLIRQYDIGCIKGNHEHSVIRNQSRWRDTERPERMAQIGRIISDETIAYSESLPGMERPGAMCLPFSLIVVRAYSIRYLIDMAITQTS
jgi:hypothetical protein